MNIRVLSLFIFGPLLFYPLSFCPFSLPYLYCFICPVGCNWGRARGIILLTVLGLNIKKDVFCKHLCPFGNMQHFLFKLKTRKFSLPKFMHLFKYIILLLVAFVAGVTLLPGMLSHKFLGISLGQIVIGKIKGLFLIVFFASIAASIFIYRIFCLDFCPVKALSEILPKMKE